MTKETINSLAISLGETVYSDELCQSAAASLDMFSDSDNVQISTSGESIASGSDPVSYYITNTWSRPLTDEEKDLYWCHLNSGIDSDSVALRGGDWLIKWLPQSPDAIRIPEQIDNLFGEQTLAASLMLEIFGATWQFLVIMAIVKFYRLIPFKAT